MFASKKNPLKVMSVTVPYEDKIAPATTELSVWSISSFIEIFHGKGQVSDGKILPKKEN